MHTCSLEISANFLASKRNIHSVAVGRIRYLVLVIALVVAMSPAYLIGWFHQQ